MIMNKTELLLSEGWKFHFGECEEAWYQGYDDRAFERVMLPHDWAVAYPFSKQYSSGTGYLTGGIGWYRLHFYLPEEYQGKSIRLVFDSVYKNSQVWVNSYYQGKHPYGYTGFSYDISGIAHFGEQENVVSVKVTHPDIADSRWYTGSGITRKVTLVVEEQVHPAEYGVTFVTEKLVADGKEFPEVQAAVNIRHEICNQTKEQKTCVVCTKLSDPQGTPVAEWKEQVQIPAGNTVSCSMHGTIRDPKCWSPEHPDLYGMETWYETTDEDGKKISYLADKQKVGIRVAEFDADRGFFLNSVPMKIKGVCVHHDAGCLGAAVTKEIWHRRLAKLKECGCNAIRCSHNPHMPELYELCDTMGFLVMDEAFDEWENAKNKWSTGHNVYPPKHQGYFEDFPEWHEKDLRAMVRRDRNHPSIILWSIGNEIDYPNDPYCHPSFLEMTGNNDANKPAAERQYDPAKPDMRRLLPIAGELSSIVKSEDESRPVTMALAYPELSAKLGMLEHLDVAGYNYKEQYYEADHKDFPQIPFLGSENGHSYEAWDAVKSNDYISGQFLWTGIDYLGEAHGWPVHGSGAGILDCAGFEKARYYRRKSLWCEEPQLYLATRPWSEESAEWIPCRENWNYKAGEKVIVMCYSNLPETAVFINGKEAGRQIGYNDDGAYRFEVFWEAGILEASGYDENGNIIEQERLLTTQNAAGIKAEVYQPEEIPFSETQENGYLYQVALTLVDQNGQKVVWDDRKLRVAVSGAGMLAGIENGDLSDVTPYAENMRKTKDGRLMIYVRRIKKGKIRVEISETDSIAEISTITEKNRITGKTGIAEKDSTEEKGGMHLEVEMD